MLSIFYRSIVHRILISVRLRGFSRMFLLLRLMVSLLPEILIQCLSPFMFNVEDEKLSFLKFEMIV